MDSSASDSRKEIACISNFSKLSQKEKKKRKKKNKNKQEDDYHSCEHFITYLFFLILFSSVKIQRKVEIKVY